MGRLVVKPGFVYFLKLVDPQKEFEFTHYKIGETNDVPRRIKDLQTGNPFRIIEEKSIESEACNMLEHYLHGKYSPQRVGIEWFKFSDKEFKKVYSSALSFNKEITNIAKEAKEFEKTVSNGSSISPTDEMSKLYEELISLYDEVMILNKKIDIIKIKLENLTSYSSGIDGITKVITTNPNPRFDLRLFSENYSDLESEIIEKYREQIESEMKREAEIRKLRQEGQSFDDILDEEEMAEKLEFVNKGFKILGKNTIRKYPELNEEFKEIENTKIKISSDEVKQEKVDRSKESLELHDQYLSYNTEISVINGEIDIIELKLRHVCADNAGIDEICEHERIEQMKTPRARPVSHEEYEPEDYEVTIYDIGEEKIKEEYPEEYEKCFVTSKSQRRFLVFDYRAYID